MAVMGSFASSWFREAVLATHLDIYVADIDLRYVPVNFVWMLIRDECIFILLISVDAETLNILILFYEVTTVTNTTRFDLSDILAKNSGELCWFVRRNKCSVGK
jgi:hypothetical protein